MHEPLWLSSNCLAPLYTVQTLGMGMNPPCTPNSATLLKRCLRYIWKIIQDASWFI